MSIRSLSIYLSRSNYYLQLASLCRLTSRRGYSIDADKPPAETQANNIQTHASANGLITNNESSSMDTKRSSFANRRKANREIQPVQQNSVPSPSSMLRTWEKSEKRLPLNFIDIRNGTDPFMRAHQNALISKLPISATRRDIEMLTRGIFPDHENPINKICIIYNDHYKPTGSAWIQFNTSKNALLFTKCINQKTFYGNKLSVELKKYIPEETQTDPLNYYADKCVILAGLPWSVNEHYLIRYIREICDKNFKIINITSRASNPSDTSKWLLLLNSIADSYHIFSKIHNRYFDEVYQIKARVVK